MKNFRPDYDPADHKKGATAYLLRGGDLLLLERGDEKLEIGIIAVDRICRKSTLNRVYWRRLIKTDDQSSGEIFIRTETINRTTGRKKALTAKKDSRAG